MTGADSKQITVNAIFYTIQQLENEPGVRPDDPALDTLKRLLLRRIAEIDTAKDAAAVAAVPEVVIAQADTAKVVPPAAAVPEAVD